jgi:hypothetical protein
MASDDTFAIWILSGVSYILAIISNLSVFPIIIPPCCLRRG